MKKLLSVIFCLITVAALWAEKPRRFFEWGMDVGAGFGNSFLRPTDIFNSDRLIKIDLDEFAKRSFDIAFDAEAKTFFALNPNEKWSFQLYTGVDAKMFSSISQEIAAYLAEGNADKSDFTGTGNFGFSVFADVGLKGSRKWGKWTFGATPAVYAPLLYSSKPEMKVRLNTGESLEASLMFDTELYSAIPLEDYLSSLLPESATMSGASSSQSFPLGFDLSLAAEYDLFPVFSVGGVISHIPIVPATMNNRARIRASYELPSGQSLLDMLTGDEFDAGDIKYDVNFDDNGVLVFRPLRFDVFAQYKPFSSRLVVLKPSIGFSVLTVYGDMLCLNGGLEAQLNLGRVFTLSASSSLLENIWRQQAGFELNLKVLELDLGVSSQSQDFLGSFQLRGLGVTFGLRLGW
ncbi:hypothetical protein AGMMS49928_05350 [Spirochaetia bacterium]|nr:hypothetical protein AGMMS49928_05350 [Spirochaetia bacterium]